jgi:hypothetical protein
MGFLGFRGQVFQFWIADFGLKVKIIQELRT